MIDGRVIDIEGNGLNPDTLYCLSYVDTERPHPLEEVVTVLNKDDMRAAATVPVVIGHNFSLWDAPVLDRLVGTDLKEVLIIDTLFLSWYLYPTRTRHGLEEWGEELGVPKPKIIDWENLSLDEYINRNREDVKINYLLWKKMYRHLLGLYETDENIWKLLTYLGFKAKAARASLESGWRVDVPRAEQVLTDLIRDRDDRVQSLARAMPPVAKAAKRNRPAKPYRKDGTLSSSGEQWEQECKKQGKDPWKTTELKIVTGYVDPNPNSHPQLKDWLFSLGWKPCTFKYEKKDGVEREIPQISSLEDKSELSDSVKLLIPDNPSLIHLEGLFLLNHRISILEGFLEAVDDKGFIKAEIAGLTNTLRFKHKTVVNLPGVDKPYGKEVRGCLIAPEGWELCGSDMASLEDRTKQHYIYEYDPDYVEEMNTPDFDPHLDLAVLAGMMTSEDSATYKAGDHSKKPVRHKAKTTNYSCTYGAFPPKIARTADIPLEEAQVLWETYWKRNWAVKVIAENQKVITYDGQKWLWNPVSGLYYSLRKEKDRFSTLNQGTGSYCFDVWGAFVYSRRPQFTAQFHDEYVFTVKKGHRHDLEEILQWAIEETNKTLGLNRRLDISIEFGDSYAEIH